MTPVRILIADDHELIRDGLRARIEMQPAWQVCGEAENGRQAVDLAMRLMPDVALLDVGMPELNGIDAARQIRKACPESAVLILTMQESEALIREALNAGARGFLIKTDAARLLPVAINALLANKPFFTSRVADVMLTSFLESSQNTTESAGTHSQLTMREREIVQLLAEAHSSKVIATRLGISVKTVDAHRANVMRKLNLHSIAELVRYAIRNNIVGA